jgi:hypothetical protein
MRIVEKQKIRTKAAEEYIFRVSTRLEDPVF